MEVASIMSYNMPQSYGSRFHSQQYPQYHDMRSHYPPALPSGYSNNQQIVDSDNASHITSASSEDPNKPSLPSISTLIGIADGDRGAVPRTESQSSTEKLQSQPSVHPSSEQYPQSSYTSGMDVGVIQRSNMPPTPPLRADSLVENGHSPSTISSAQSSISGPSYQLGSALNNVEAGQQRSYVPLTKPQPVPRQNIYTTSPYAMGPYMASPSTMSQGSYYSPEVIYQTNMYNQRPLPSNFPPTVIAAPMLPPGMIASHNPWEHHHYITHNQANYASVQDRYICTTCRKAFSRPSSLKIHSHSHTGEKPFKCPHTGCGKAFSVRSNMKRHERGCHAGEGGDGSTSS